MPRLKKTIIFTLIIIFVVIGIFTAFLILKNNTLSEENFGEIYYSSVDEKHIHSEANEIKYADNEILINVTEGTTIENVKELAKKYNTDVVGMIEFSGDYQLKTKSQITNSELKEMIDDIKKENIVVNASLNYIQSYFDNIVAEGRDGFYYGEKWQSDLQNFNDAKGKSWGLEAIETLSAWDLLNNHSNMIKPVKVGVIDGGFDSAHKDLGFDELFYEDNKNSKKSPDSESKEHGTHVSGIIAAKNNDKTGICGVYPYGNGNVYAVNLCKNGISSYSENGTFWNSIMGQKIAFAELIVRNVKVINQSQGFNWYKNIDEFKKNSMGGEYIDYNMVKDFFENNDFSEYEKESDLLGDFLNRMLKKGYDFVIVSAAGNDSDSSVGHLESRFSSWDNLISETKYPDVYNRIIVVGAVNSEYKISDSSNTGSRVDIFAPGEGIFSTIPNNKYGKMSGTSQAAPHVSGVAAMVWSANNNLTGAQVKEAICRRSNIRCTSCKMVDAYCAVEYALDKTNKSESSRKSDKDNGILMSFVVQKGNESVKVKNATVTAENKDTHIMYSCKTDTYGHFELVLPNGNYDLFVTAEGYKDYSKQSSIHINSKETNNLDWIKIDREYTAEDLINKSVKDIAKLMGNKFDVEKGMIETFFYFHNYDVFPGLDFYVKFSDYTEYNVERLKRIIRNGYIDLYAIQVNKPGKACCRKGKIIDANLDYKKCAETYGKIDCYPTPGALLGGTVGALGYTETKKDYNITINFELNEKLTKLIYNSTDFSNKISYDKMISENPNIKNIVLRKNSLK